MAKIPLGKTDWDLLDEDKEFDDYKYIKPRPSKKPKLKYKDYSENYEYNKRYRKQY